MEGHHDGILPHLCVVEGAIVIQALGVCNEVPADKTFLELQINKSIFLMKAT